MTAVGAIWSERLLCARSVFFWCCFSGWGWLCVLGRGLAWPFPNPGRGVAGACLFSEEACVWPYVGVPASHAGLKLFICLFLRTLGAPAFMLVTNLRLHLLLGTLL